jgi:cytoskeletal protein RodZ
METPEKQTPRAETRFGKAMIDAREAAGVDLRWISDTTKIQMRYLAALESEDWGKIPGGIIGRGFVRIIAKELDADVKMLTDLYAKARGEEAPNSMKPPPDTEWRVGPSNSMLNPKLIAALATLLVCIGVVMWLWRPWEDTGAEAAPATSGEATMHRLEVRALESTWLTVKARDAKTDRYELEPAATLNLEVIAPVVLKSDNAASIQLSWDNISLKPLGKQGEPLDLVLPEGLVGLKP